MIKAAGYTDLIIRGDTIVARVTNRVTICQKNLVDLLKRTYSTVALSIDGWTSLNDLSMLAVNGTWAGPDIKLYRACFEFIEVQGAHLGENLAHYIYNIGKRLDILPKILTITGDNASNNDTICRHLANMLETEFDRFLDDLQLRGQSMRFKGENSQIGCFGHINNLVVKAILKSLGSSTHKDAVSLLNRANDYGWKEITVPLASGNIVILRLVVLWIHRSPQRIQQWKQRKGVKRLIPYDMDTRWNYTLVIVEVALEYYAQLQDFIKDNPELKHLQFTPDRWRRLTQVRDLLKPFEEYTLMVSREEPSLNLVPSLYVNLWSTLNQIIEKEGEYAAYDSLLIKAAEKGLEKFNGYWESIKSIDIY